MFFLLFLLASVLAAPPSDLQTLRKYFLYGEASFCNHGLADWECFWCTYEPWLPPLKMQKIINHTKDTGTLAFIGVNNDHETIVAFRGTANIINWVNNADFFGQEYPKIPNAFVHRGFFRGYSGMSSDVISGLQAAQKSYPNNKVIIIGHSLGGALAILLGLDVFTQYPNLMVITYGGPRVGNQAFADYVQKHIPQFYRVVNEHDLVPHLPQTIFEYVHAPTEIYLTNNSSKFKVCSSTTGEDKTCCDSETQYYLEAHTTYFNYDSETPSDCRNNFINN